MVKEVTAVGKDILEAKENARAALGVGELEKKLTVKGCTFSKTAIEKIEAAGGKAEVM